MSGSEVSDLRVNIFHEFLHPRNAVTAMVFITAAIPNFFSMSLLRRFGKVKPGNSTALCCRLKLHQLFLELMVESKLLLIFLFPRDGLLSGWTIAALEDFGESVVDP